MKLRDRWEILLVIALAAVVYQPWAAPALPLTDFGVFMPKMDVTQSLLSQYVSVAAYHITEGRLALVQYVYMVFAKNVFGFDPAGWHWMYFVVNCVVLVLGRELMLRTGVNRTAAFIALALWATMAPVAEGWIRPTGEPFALIFFLAACCMLVNFNEKEDWKRRAILVALCSVGVLLSKEILVVLLPSAWLISRVRFAETGSALAPWTKRDTFLIATVSCALVIALAAVAWVVLSAPQGYSAKYGEVLQTPGAFLRRLEMILIPTTPRLDLLSRVMRDPAWILALVLPSLLWIRAVLTGVVAGGRTRIGWPLVIAAVWIGIGMIAYLPWTSSGEFYFTPFALGAMFAGAHALSRGMERSPSERRLAFLTAALLVCITSVEARSVVYKFQLRAVLNDAVVKSLQHSNGTDLLVGAVAKPVPDARWWWSRNLEGFVVAATGARIGASRDVTCADAVRLAEGHAGAVIVSREGACGRIVPTSVAVTAHVPRMQWPYLWEEQVLRDRVYITTVPARVTSAVRPVEAPL